MMREVCRPEAEGFVGVYRLVGELREVSKGREWVLNLQRKERVNRLLF
jgi:hypothetical protein